VKRKTGTEWDAVKGKMVVGLKGKREDNKRRMRRRDSRPANKVIFIGQKNQTRIGGRKTL